MIFAKGGLRTVNVVGVVKRAVGCTLPDFRMCAERTFQILAQVDGAGGRGDKCGPVHGGQTSRPRTRQSTLAVEARFRRVRGDGVG